MLPDEPERLAALGFEIVGGSVLLPGMRLILRAPRMSVAIDGVSAIEGLALGEAPPAAPVYSRHPNGAVGVDHVVAITPDFDGTSAALERAGLPLKRIRDAGGFRQGFRRLGGGTILELVEASAAGAPGWWGLTIAVPDLGLLPSALITDPKAAVQPGRLIATARSPGTPLAFITQAS